MSGTRADYIRRPAVHAELLAPYRLLALRVISLAVRDLVTDGHSLSERNSARTFLSGSRMLTYWCKLADLDPAAISDQIRDVAQHKRMVRVVMGS